MKLSIEWKYQTPKRQEISLRSEFLPANETLLLAEDFEKTGRVKELVFYDEQDTKWTKKEILKLLKEIDTEPSDIIAYFDGGYDLASQTAGLGIAIYFVQNGKKYRIRKNVKIAEIDSNNEAEYVALWNVLLSLEEMGANHVPVIFRGDSIVVLNQLSGAWPCFEDNLNQWLDRIEGKIKQQGFIPKYEPISRKQNNEADKLATQALQGVNVISKLEISGK
jgi:ribonuclease HI